MELLLVMLILIVLASVVVPIYFGHMERSRRQATIVDIAMLEQTLARFEIENGRFPTTGEGLAALVECPADLTDSWHGPYVKRVPTDKWGHDYIYKCPGDKDVKSFDVVSIGRDGMEGTADDIDKYTTE
jgi:general secretion pathway protein G